MTDKKIVNIISTSVFAVLLLAFILPLGESGRIIAALLLLPAAALTFVLIKKRNILSVNKNQILLIVSVSAMVIVMIYYLTGLKFGFYNNPYKLSVNNFFKFFVPIAVIIVSTEVVRFVMMAQKSRLAHVLCYLTCVIAEMLICSNLVSVSSFNRFMDLVAGALFPALISNFLFNYLSKRYGMYPNIAFRAITTLHSYVFAVTPGISESLVNLFKLLIPIILYLFIDSLYEKKKKYALGGQTRFSRVTSTIIALLVIAIMLITVMLISNQFKYGIYVVATESMTGEINKGDAVIYEKYDDQIIKVGQVIAFEDGRSVFIHRVVKIEIINGEYRFYTKGDANEHNDTGYVVKSEIVGLVDHKVPYIGYPTIWARSLFKR